MSDTDDWSAGYSDGYQAATEDAEERLCAVLQERDEAREKLEATEAALYYVKEQRPWYYERGYRKGVEDAAKVADNAVIPIDDNEWDDHNRACETVRAAILALLEQKLSDLHHNEGI